MPIPGWENYADPEKVKIGEQKLLNISPPQEQGFISKIVSKVGDVASSVGEKAGAVARSIAPSYTAGLSDYVVGKGVQTAGDIGKVLGLIDNPEGKVDALKKLGLHTLENMSLLTPTSAIALSQLGKHLGFENYDYQQFNDIVGDIKAQRKEDVKIHPALTTTGDLVGMVLPGSVFVKGIGWINKAWKSTKYVPMVAKAVGAMTGLAAVENAPQVMTGEKTLGEAGKDVGKSALWSVPFAVGGEAVSKVLAPVAEKLLVSLPTWFAKIKGRLSKSTLETYNDPALRTEVNTILKDGEEGYNKISDFVNANNKIIEDTLSSVPGKINITPIVDEANTIISDLKRIKFSVPVKNAINMIEENKKLWTTEISASELNAFKKQIADLSEFDWSKIAPGNKIDQSFKRIWGTVKDMENKVGGESVIKANEYLSKEIELAKTLNMKSVYSKEGATTAEKLASAGKNVGGELNVKGYKLEDAYKGIDDLTAKFAQESGTGEGTTFLRDMKVQNAVREFLVEDKGNLVTLLKYIGGGLGGWIMGGGSPTGALVGLGLAAGASPQSTRRALGMARWGRGVSKTLASPAVKTGITAGSQAIGKQVKKFNETNTFNFSTPMN
jgi:hypothetical protein